MQFPEVGLDEDSEESKIYNIILKLYEIELRYQGLQTLFNESNLLQRSLVNETEKQLATLTKEMRDDPTGVQPQKDEVPSTDYESVV